MLLTWPSSKGSTSTSRGYRESSESLSHGKRGGWPDIGLIYARRMSGSFRWTLGPTAHVMLSMPRYSSKSCISSSHGSGAAVLNVKLGATPRPCGYAEGRRLAVIPTGVRNDRIVLVSGRFIGARLLAVCGSGIPMDSPSKAICRMRTGAVAPAGGARRWIAKPIGHVISDGKCRDFDFTASAQGCAQSSLPDKLRGQHLHSKRQLLIRRSSLATPMA